jgi:hypothetical protein
MSVRLARPVYRTVYSSAEDINGDIARYADIEEDEE